MTTLTQTGRQLLHGGLRRTILSEWTKFRSIRSSFWTLLISTALTIGIGASFLPFVIDGFTPAHPGQSAASVAIGEGWWFEGLHVGIVAVMILGVLVATTEYSTGTIRATFAAVPSRTRVLVAKATSFSLVTLAAGAVQSSAAFLAARPILASHSIEVALFDPAAWRGVATATLATVGAGLFGLAAGLLLRHTAAAIGAVIGVMWVVSGLAALLPASWSGVVDVLPASVLYAMFTPYTSTLTTWPAAAVFFSYVTGMLIVAGILLNRRDA
jgi:ABC-2 type transport system permease protein